MSALTELPSPTAVVRILAKAKPLLVYLQDGPMYKSELAEEIGVSKSTVYNWTRELQDHDVVERTSRGYRLTRVGRIHVEMFLVFGDVSERIYRLAPLLRALPADDLPPEAVLRSCRIVTARSNPDAPVEVLLSLLDDADRVFGTVPVLGSRLAGAVGRALQAGDLGAEFTVPEATMDALRDTHAFVIEAFENSDRSELHVTDRCVGFGALAFAGDDTSVALLAYTDRGHLDVVLLAESDEAVAWAWTVAEDEPGFRTDSTRSYYNSN